jgi:hypothetical protein
VNLTACAGLPRTVENGVWYRATRIGFLPGALNSAHTAATTSRFNAGPLHPVPQQFESIYFASDHVTALFEFGAMAGTTAPGGGVSNPALSTAIVNVSVTLREVVDLTDVAVQASLATTAQELTGDWNGYQLRSNYTPVKNPIGVAPTQELGEVLFRAGVEGIRSISARIPYNRILVVFPLNLRLGSSLVFSGDHGTSQRINGTRA